jgi:hypothetical protein
VHHPANKRENNQREPGNQGNQRRRKRITQQKSKRKYNKSKAEHKGKRGKGEQKDDKLTRTKRVKMHDAEECGCIEKIQNAHFEVIKWLHSVTDNLALNDPQVCSGTNREENKEWKGAGKTRVSKDSER